MVKWLSALLITGGLQGAVLRGVILERQTGKPLSRSLVEVQPVPGTAGTAKAVRTDLSGAFTVIDLSPGQYLVAASRPGFLRTQYGQREWNAAGRPVTVDESQAAFVEIRLPRFGAIGGTILDEEDIGLPAHDVVAYKNTKPPELVGHAVTDDRGVYRLSGLEPGTYLVRSTGRKYTEGNYIPTFGKDAEAVDQAHPVVVDLDRTTEGADIRPAQGALYAIIGDARPVPQSAVATITFASDTGRQTIRTDGSFSFPPVPKGKYEIYAQAPSSDGTYVTGGYLKLDVNHDETEVHIHMSRLESTRIEVGVSNGPAIRSTGFQLLARRRDLAGVTEPQAIKLGVESVSLGPGRWEVMLLPLSGYYVQSVQGGQATQVVPGRPDGWNEILVQWTTFVRFNLSNHPGSIHGRVLGGDGKPVAGAPVALEAYDNGSRQRILNPHASTTDSQGRYGFTDVPPGSYRLLATFEYQSPPTEVFDRASAAVVDVEEGHDRTQDLTLWEFR